MFLFGHLGIGSYIARPWGKTLSKKWILIGTILPDLIDKSLFYGMSAITGKSGTELGLISGTRTFGHTFIFFTSLTGISICFAIFRKSKIGIALTLGAATHLLLDCILDGILHSNYLSVPLLWPLPGWEFPTYPHSGITSHLSSGRQTPILMGEIMGIIALLRQFRKQLTSSSTASYQTKLPK